MTNEIDGTNIENLSRQEKVDQYIARGDYSLGGLYPDQADQDKIRKGDYVFGIRRSVDNKLTKQFSVHSQLVSGRNSTSLEQLRDHQIVALPSHCRSLRLARYIVINLNPMGKYGNYIYEPEFLRKFRNNEILVINKFIKPLKPVDDKEVA
jgi:hypothetical protein|tara:strand:+ start:77 stop:529 length:453 start_codon:yes stop_codon:yes gene_type:complete